MLVYRQIFNLQLESLPIAIPVELDSDRIVFEAMPTYTKPSWKNAGTITRRFLVHGVGFVKDEPKTVLIGNTLIEFPIEAKYYLEFQPFKWLDSEMQISIWKVKPESIPVQTFPQFNLGCDSSSLTLPILSNGLFIGV
jgi:hypothetical protein